MKQMIEILREHSFFQDLSEEDLKFVSGCAKNVVFNERDTIARVGDLSSCFYLIREGQIALSLDVTPGKPFVFQTLNSHDIVGLAWLIPPYRWTVTAQAIQSTSTIAFDGARIRKKCEEDPSLGFALMKHIVQLLIFREDALRLHLLDVYGDVNSPAFSTGGNPTKDGI